MPKIFALIALIVIGLHCSVDARPRRIIVVDSESRMPLPNASVYGADGKALGMSNKRGLLPDIDADRFPIEVRYVGFHPQRVKDALTDTVFMVENAEYLPELTVATRHRNLLHVLAYVREYSTLSTFSDTVYLFREKMVDFMLPVDRKPRYKGWRCPRILKSKSYYRFTNSEGLDSVSDEGRNFFSWTDWIWIPKGVGLPPGIRNSEAVNDTLWGKYSVREIWTRSDDGINVEIDALADSSVRRWVPGMAAFFAKDVDFDCMKVRFGYENTASDTLMPADIREYSFSIGSTGRGRDMFMFNRRDEPFFVSTDAHVYVLNKEFVTAKEARQWEKHVFDPGSTELYVPRDVPPPAPDILAMIDRVNHIDKGSIKLETKPDSRLAGVNLAARNKNFRFGYRALAMLKQLVGITSYKANRKWKRSWNDMRNERIARNKERNKADKESK